jgi:hypothetical protein
LLGAADPALDAAGRLYAHQQVRRLQLALIPYPTEGMNMLARHRFARTLRPLTALGRLAARDIQQFPSIEPEATPARAIALLFHRLFGFIA